MTVCFPYSAGLPAAASDIDRRGRENGQDKLLPEGRCVQAQGFSVGYGRLFGWFQPMSVTPRNLNTSNRALP